MIASVCKCYKITDLWIVFHAVTNTSLSAQAYLGFVGININIFLQHSNYRFRRQLEDITTDWCCGEGGLWVTGQVKSCYANQPLILYNLAHICSWAHRKDHQKFVKNLVLNYSELIDRTYVPVWSSLSEPLNGQNSLYPTYNCTQFTKERWSCCTSSWACNLIPSLHYISTK